jgi:hypothetical protein
MPRARKYPPELIERGVRLAFKSKRPVANVADGFGIERETCANTRGRPRPSACIERHPYSAALPEGQAASLLPRPADVAQTGAKLASAAPTLTVAQWTVGVAQTGGLSGGLRTILGVPQNFLECDREQVFLMPPDPRDWLPEGHLAWFVGVGGGDGSRGVLWLLPPGWVGSRGVRAFDDGGAALYAYARGERSSRAIERRCVEDVAYRVIACQQTPDHATIARFRVRHEAALAELFSEVLGLCRESGLVKVGLIAIDGTKVHANASHHSNLDYEQLDPSGCCKQSSAFRRTCGSSAKRTMPMSTIARLP